jgi:hypothetical protein
MLYLRLSRIESLRGLIDKLDYSLKIKEIINIPNFPQLSRTNAKRDYRIFEDNYYRMVDIAKRKLEIKSLNEKFKEIKAFDSTIIIIVSSLAPNLYLENNLSAIKISTLLSILQKLPEKVQMVPTKVNNRK